MDNKRYERWLTELEHELAFLEGLDISAVQRWRQAVPLIDKVTVGLKAQMLADGFAGDKDEICFFKQVKPRFYALRIFEQLLYRFTVNQPVGTSDMLRQYYQQELLACVRETQADGYHYQYYKSGATELDNAYFLRSATGGDVPVIELNDPVADFSAPLDMTFARFMAYERMQEYILSLLSGNLEVIAKSSHKNALRWTGESINLVELAYGIWLTGQLNHGNASISQIVEWLEVKLQVNIGLAFRRWSSIAARKRISVTKFTDKMREAILKRVDEENER